MKIHALSCGWLTAPMGAFVEGEAGTITAPVLSFLIEHPKGRAVFDTGLPRALRQDAAATIGADLATLYQSDFRRQDDVDQRLESLGVDPASIDLIINSHLHFDHCAGNDLLPNARVLVQAREAEALHQAPPSAGFDARTMLEGRDVQTVDGEFDIFGDGSVVLLPTYGHTAGHQSLRLRCTGGDVILAGDCCYFHRTLSDRKLPPFGHDREAQNRSLDRLAALERGGARIIAGHDPGQWPMLRDDPVPRLGD